MFQLQLFFLLHCDEWDRVVALPRHKFVTGATLLQLYTSKKKFFFKSQYWYTILEQIFIQVLCTILVHQYCDRQVQESLEDYVSK
jgi:hypothetical protein